MTAEALDNFIESTKRTVMNTFPLSDMKDEALHDAIEDLVAENLSGQYIPLQQRAMIVEAVYSSIRGLGILDTIMADDTITEVMINGPDCIFVEQNGRVHRLNQTFESEKKLRDIIQRIVGKAGRAVDEAHPIVDTRLESGDRVNVVLRPISLTGPIVTIRKFSKNPMTIEKLIQYGSITKDIADFLELLVRSKYNIFISGGTGSGKTTFLNALSNYIPKDERIITIEDSAELQIEGIENLVSLESRNANSSGEGEITIRDLIKSSLRMRPDRIVDMMSRLETMVIQGSEGLPLAAIRQQIASALDIVIHLSRLRDHSRKTMEISEVIGIDERGNIKLNPLFQFKEDKKLSTMDHVVGSLQRTENAMVKTDKLELAGIHITI